jgi:hypothetical protein
MYPTSNPGKDCYGWLAMRDLTYPIIGVAKSDWKLEQLKDRAKDSLDHHGGTHRRFL